MSVSAADYRPREAEPAARYRVIAEHRETFLETARRHSDGSSLPEFVEQERQRRGGPTDEEVGVVLARMQRLLERRGLDAGGADLQPRLALGARLRRRSALWLRAAH